MRSRILHIFLICIATVLGSSVSRASQKIQPLTAGSFWSSDSYLGGDDCLGNSKEWAKIGVNIKNQSTWFVGQTFESFVLPLLAQTEVPAFGIVSPQYLGELAQSGKIENLDPYFASIPAKTDKILSDVLPIYRSNYMQFEHRNWALPIDGDVLVLHYRPSFFNRKDLKAKFIKQFGRELHIPETWDEFDETAAFFTRELKSVGVYGNYVFNTDPWVWSYLYSRLALVQPELFDDNFHPRLNTTEVADAIRSYQKLASFSHPGIEDLSGGAAVKEWANKQVVMTVWWSDLQELSSSQKYFDNDSAIAPLPGLRKTNGVIQRLGHIPYGRVIVIPSAQSPERKKKIFKLLFDTILNPQLMRCIANPKMGIDPFLFSQFKNAEQYLEWSKYNHSNIQSLHQVKNLLDVSFQEINRALPQPNWPGSFLYLNSLGRGIRQVLLNQSSVDQVLQRIELEWIDIRNRLGYKEQLKYWIAYRAQLREALKKADYKDLRN